MRKIASLLCAVAASAVLATSGFSPALAQSPAPPFHPITNLFRRTLFNPTYDGGSLTDRVTRRHHEHGC
ncbi:hypothetical protein [Arthrobacter sp. lap29]|uniref:hypothetical protein n=1 Tax=Arthrobacter sp. lap29 TaxID=3056122 RepID=UPI0028F6DCB7|nr:hypothetical protein [Arthrobacter sp. lap29]